MQHKFVGLFFLCAILERFVRKYLWWDFLWHFCVSHWFSFSFYGLAWVMAFYGMLRGYLDWSTWVCFRCRIYLLWNEVIVLNPRQIANFIVMDPKKACKIILFKNPHLLVNELFTRKFKFKSVFWMFNIEKVYIRDWNFLSPKNNI